MYNIYICIYMYVTYIYIDHVPAWAYPYSKVYDFPHIHRHFVGQQNSSNVHADPLLAPYQRLDSLVGHVCYKANSDACMSYCSDF